MKDVVLRATIEIEQPLIRNDKLPCEQVATLNFFTKSGIMVWIKLGSEIVYGATEFIDVGLGLLLDDYMF